MISKYSVSVYDANTGECVFPDGQINEQFKESVFEVIQEAYSHTSDLASDLTYRLMSKMPQKHDDFYRRYTPY